MLDFILRKKSVAFWMGCNGSPFVFVYVLQISSVGRSTRWAGAFCPCPPWFELFLEPNWCCGHNPLLINHQTWHNMCGGVQIIPQIEPANCSLTSWQIEIRGNSWVRLRFHKAVQFFWNKTHSTNLRNHMIPGTAFLCVSMNNLNIAWFHSFTW